MRGARETMVESKLRGASRESHGVRAPSTEAQREECLRIFGVISSSPCNGQLDPLGQRDHPLNDARTALIILLVRGREVALGPPMCAPRGARPGVCGGAAGVATSCAFIGDL